MSADSPIRVNSKNLVGTTTVLPEVVTDRTILDSVTGFINDVVPTSYNLPTDSKDQIQWARFEHLDSDEASIYIERCDGENVLPSPLLLILGYSTGMQVWSVAANGEATEILSWRHGTVRVIRILPTPSKVGQKIRDIFSKSRPLIALCDTTIPSADFCCINFFSLRSGHQEKSIQFTNPVLDIVANKRSVVVTFSERIAVFDACNLEDRLTITTCYISPGIYPNPIALGPRWIAYAENKLIPARRSSGGNDSEGVQSYTATVIHAAKSIGRGLREFGETVASSFSGNTQHKSSSTTVGSQSPNPSEVQQKGVVTILDIENVNHNVEKSHTESVVAHFTAHKEAVVYLSFDPSGVLLLTADKQGHDFHLFRIHSHPGGPTLAAVHHLYTLHRGDTTARVQDMCFSPDSRWVTVSTMRGTTHVFPITPYGGNIGVRTHASMHVVNKMSRFHRSAGLTAEGRSNSPVSVFETPINSTLPYQNPRLPPFPHPTVINPLAQIRQPQTILQLSASQQRPVAGRQRSSSSSEESSQTSLRVTASFAPGRAWFDELASQTREAIVTKPTAKPVESLFIMSCHGSLLQYDLEPHHSSSVPKEKVCDDTQIELTVHARAQWLLQRQPGNKDMQLPLSAEHLNNICKEEKPYKTIVPDHTDDRWLSQVEIITHAGPHRRLWMGPQFTFKTYNNSSGTTLSNLETKPIDLVRSKPVNMPKNSSYPVLIEAGSLSSYEQSPKLAGNHQKNLEEGGVAYELQLREDLADAMLESPGLRDAGGRCVIVSMKPHNSSIAKIVNPLGMVVTVHSDDDLEMEPQEEIIHENCDEALFRPVVACKAVIFAEPRNIRSKIATSVLHINKFIPKFDSTKIVYDGQSKQSFVDASKPIRDDLHKQFSTNNLISTTQDEKLRKISNNSDKINIVVRDNILSNLSNLENSAITTENTNSKKTKNKQNKIKCPKQTLDETDSFDTVIQAKENIYKNNTVKGGICNDDLFVNKQESANDSPQVLIKKDNTVDLFHDSFFDANDCNDSDLLDINISKTSEIDIACADKMDNAAAAKLKTDLLQDDNVDDKQTMKKPRKPKSKLGIRISSLYKPAEEKEDVLCPVRTWSSIISKNLVEDNSTIKLKQTVDILPDEVSANFSLESNVKYSEDDIDILEMRKCVHPEDTTYSLGAKKLEEDEKAENNSSQTETTESDDSSKVAPIVIMDTDEDPQFDVTKSKQSGNKSKKSKKKRTGGEQSVTDCSYRDTEDFSSTSSFSSASRASPTPSYSGDNLIHFPGDSSSSI